MTSVDVSLDSVWGDAWAVYKLLFRRSVTTAAIVFALLEGLEILVGVLASVALSFAGAMLVQGALVEIVRNVHEGRQPKSIARLLRTASRRIVSLVGASVLWTLGVLLGLVLLIVPGLLVASRWSVMAPLVMLEGETARRARNRSSELVKPYTWPVLGIVIATYLVTTVIESIPAGVWAATGDINTWVIYSLDVLTSALTAPFFAHVLTVIYYRITEPEAPVIHPDVHSWNSVWQGA